MKLNRLETHDRLLHFKKHQEANIYQGAEDCLKKNPDSLFFQDRSPYVYIFAHPRTDDDGVNKRMLWQPRLTKPLAQSNSYLFRAQSKSDIVEVCWILPPSELWSQYIGENVTGDKDICWYIDQFRFNREILQANDPDDLPADRIWAIQNELRMSKKKYKRIT